jgi:elongation factor 3
MSASQRDVREAAHAATLAVCQTQGNADLDGCVPRIVSCLLNPEELPDVLHFLAGTVFVQEVQAPALALVEPVLMRGIRLRPTAMRRKAAVVIDNLCKLLSDPSEAAAFLPRVVPALQKAADELTDVEARSVVQRAHDALVRAGEGAEAGTVVPLADIITSIRAAMPHAQGGEAARDIVSEYIAAVAHGLALQRNKSMEDWEHTFSPLSQLLGAGDDFIAQVRAACERADVQQEREEEECTEEGEVLCDCEFSLAYGSKILLANTRLHLKRGMRYGLVGPNDCGKSTLLRSIANGQIEGFPPPEELRTVYVEHDVQGIEDGTTIIDFVMMDPKVTAVGVTQSEAEEILEEIGFNSKKAQGGQLVTNPVATLSGGWKMKLALARAILSKADILLCDEPTNHLDVENVAWVTDYLQTAKKADGGDISTICVSHDSKFMDTVCSHIIHFESRKLKTYRGNLKAFVDKVPDAGAYYTLKACRKKFVFPEPSMLEGVKSKAKHILKMTNVAYQYPSAPSPILNDVSVAVTLGSRIAVIGPNGAGKSTAIKVLTGELPPSRGSVWRHPNMRFAYVAQHAFHHLEAHLEKTPVEYILWRYSAGFDKELASQETLKYTEEEKAIMAKKISVISATGEERKWVLERIVSRRKTKKTYEYEVKWEGQPMENNTWMAMEKLTSLGFQKMIAEVDIRENAKLGLSSRALTTKFVMQQLDELGLDMEYAAHVRISELSGGQKVRVVLAAAMWGQPHVLILDEPTNYLDRDALAALAIAIRGFGGGVVIISHNRDFVEEVCRTMWFMVDGSLVVEGDDEVDEKIEEKLGPETYTDAAGNVHEVKKEKQLTKAEIKKTTKLIKEKIKKGIDLDEEEENFAIEFDL